MTLPYFFPGYNEQNPGYNEQKWKVFFKLTKNKHFFSLKLAHFTLFKLKKKLITNFNYTNLAMKMDVAIFPSWHSLKGKILLGFV